MATYNSYRELIGNVLKEGDKVIFNVSKSHSVSYVVTSRYLNNISGGENNRIFSDLGLSKTAFTSEAYGYSCLSGEWPECKPYDYEALTRATLGLYKKIEGITSTSMSKSLIEKARLLVKSEPEKSLTKKGITDINDNLTSEGKELFADFLYRAHKDEFVKDPVVAAILSESDEEDK